MHILIGIGAPLCAVLMIVLVSSFLYTATDEFVELVWFYAIACIVSLGLGVIFYFDDAHIGTTLFILCEFLFGNLLVASVSGFIAATMAAAVGASKAGTKLHKRREARKTKQGNSN